MIGLPKEITIKAVEKAEEMEKKAGIGYLIEINKSFYDMAITLEKGEKDNYSDNIE